MTLLNAPRCATTLPSAASMVTPGLFLTFHKLEVSGISGAKVRNSAANGTLISRSPRISPSRPVRM